MSTSLSRQLSQLKATSSVHAEDSLIADGSFDKATLHQVAKEAFHALVEDKIPELSGYWSLLWPESPSTLPITAPKATELKSLLSLIAPYALLKDVQWILQFLVTEKKLHVSEPEMFFVTLLPFFEYEIFARAVKILPEKSCPAYPNWLRNFKASCTPVSKQGMLRHISGNDGFLKLLTDSVLPLKPLGAKLAHFYASYVTLALNTMDSLREAQLIQVLRVIFEGLKSGEKEFRSLAYVLLSFLLPRKEVTEKVSGRLLKILSAIPPCREVLSLAVVLYRSQGGVQDKALKLLLKMEDIISGVFAQEVEVEDASSYKSVTCDTYVMCLASLIKEETSLIIPTPELDKLLSIISNMLGHWSPGPEAAKALAAKASILQIRMKALKKEEIKRIVKSISRSCKKILSIIRLQFPYESNKYSLKKSSAEADILFMDETNDSPNEAQIQAKRILLDEPFVNSTLSKKILTFVEYSKLISSGEAGENIELVSKVMEQNPQDFLLRQMDPLELLSLTVNSMRLYPKNEGLIQSCASVFIALFESEEHKKLIEDETGLKIRLLALPLIFAYFPSIRKSANLMRLKMFPELGVHKDTSTNFNREVYLNLIEKVYSLTASLADEVDRKGEAYQDPVLLIIGLLSFSEDKSDPLKSSSAILRFLNYIVSSKMPMEDGKVDEPEEWILRSLKDRSNGLNDLLLEHVFDKIPKMGHFSVPEFERIANEFILFASKSEKRRFKNLFFRIKTFIRSWCTAQSYSYDNILANLFSLPLSSVSPNIVAKLLAEFLPLVDKCRLTCKNFVVVSSHVFPRVLANLSDPDRTPETMSLCFDILNAAQSGKLRATSKNENFIPLIGFILKNRSEIEADLDNIPLVMKEFKGKNEEQNLVALSKLCVASDVHIFARLSVFLINVPQVNLLAQFAYEKLMAKDRIENEFTSSAWSHIFDYFFHKMIAFLTLRDNECSKFFWSLMKSSHKMSNGRFVSTMALEVLESHVLLVEDQVALFSQFVELSGCPEVESETLMASRLVMDKLNKVDVECFLKKLEDIWGSSFFKEPTQASRKRFSSEELNAIQLKWSKTHFLMEFILRRSGTLGLEGGIPLIKPYFVLLKHALFYDESEVHESYSQDLILSGVLSLIEGLNENQLSRVDSINPELIVHCIRNSRIPTTKSTALLILAKSSACNPDYVLHNSIPIFTFMGNHFVKMDSKHSFDVACQAIEIIIPHIQKVCGSNEERLRSTSVKIITTFADAADDLPSHRFTTFLHKLLGLLGKKEYLWIFAMQLLSKSLHQKAKKANEIHLKLMDLFESFDVLTQLETIIRLALNTKTLSAKLVSVLALKEHDNDEKAKSEFDLLKLKGLTFINHLLGSRAFASQLSEVLHQEAKKSSSNKQHPRELELLLEVAIMNLEEVSSKDSKVHKHLVSQSEKVLESALNILPNEALVGLLKSLLATKSDSVLKKTLEVLNIKLSAGNFNEKDVDLLLPLLGISFDNAVDYNRQMALMAIRSLSRLIGSQHPKDFHGVAAQLVNKKNLAKLSGQHNLEASTLLCVIEILIAIGPKAVPLLSGFMNWNLKLLATEDSVPVVLNSAILATQKVVEAFGGFLNPYYSKLITSSCSLDKSANKHIRSLMNTLAHGIPTQSLINISGKCYQELFFVPGPLENFFELLKENLGSLNKKEALSASPTLMDFFSGAFRLRLESKETDCSPDILEGLEASLIDTFLTLSLKLPLDDFKPLFYRVLNSPEESLHESTLYHLVLRVASRLKSLFNFMAEPVVTKALAYLAKRFAKKKDAAAMDGIEERVLVSSLSLEEEQTVNFALESLQIVFTYSKADTIMSSNYEDSVNAILNHYEIQEPSDKILERMNACVSSLANSTEDDSLWKYLHYQVLLNLRSTNPKIRKYILDLISLFVDSRGDSYMSVLPDAVPFLAETTEDDDKAIEKHTKDLLKKMEDVFGQSVDHFFEM